MGSLSRPDLLSEGLSGDEAVERSRPCLRDRWLWGDGLREESLPPVIPVKLRFMAERVGLVGAGLARLRLMTTTMTSVMNARTSTVITMTLIQS